MFVGCMQHCPIKLINQRWARVPGFAFPCSRVPGILGTRASGNANFIQECRIEERKRIGTPNARSCEEITQL